MLLTALHTCDQVGGGLREPWQHSMAASTTPPRGPLVLPKASHPQVGHSSRQDSPAAGVPIYLLTPVIQEGLIWVSPASLTTLLSFYSTWYLSWYGSDSSSESEI